MNEKFMEAASLYNCHCNLISCIVFMIKILCDLFKMSKHYSKLHVIIMIKTELLIQSFICKHLVMHVFHITPKYVKYATSLYC